MKSINYLLVLIISIFIGGCACAPCSSFSDSISFDFKIGSTPNGFTVDEVDTIVVYKLTKTTNNIVDSAFITNGKPFILNEFGFNFGGKEGPYWENDYRVITQGAKEFMITEIQVENKKKGIPCSCEENILKKLKVDGTSIDLSGKDENESHVQLTK